MVQQMSVLSRHQAFATFDLDNNRFVGAAELGNPWFWPSPGPLGHLWEKKNHWNNGIQDDSNIISWGFAQNGLQVTKPQ